jgi:preprotein translocase subunit SecD
VIRRQVIQLVGVTVLAVAGMLYTFIAGNAPLLGLDLQGGVSVRLVATEEADEELLDQAVEVIRNRVDGLGVAEPEISRTSNGVLVSLPGVDDSERALALVGQTAEMRFRPVCAVLPLEDPATSTTTASTTTTPVADDASTTTVAEGSETTTTVRSLRRQTTTTVAPGDATTTTPTTDDTVTDDTATDDGTAPVAPAEAGCLEALAGIVDITVDDSGLTPAAEDRADEFVYLIGDEGGVPVRFLLGPAGLTGDAVADAQARLDLSWFIELDLKSEGNDAFNSLTAACFGGSSPQCVGGRLAITLDGEVLIAPEPQQAGGFDGAVSITGNFSESEAKDLALAIRYGALPVPLEAQNTEIVSASIGEDALDAGVAAGIVGFVLVALYLLLYYRLLGLVAILSLAVSMSMLWTIIAWFGESNGLALTLAGVTGLIVSLGVAVDSNVVYYEHLKEDIRDGRNARSSVDRAFPSAFSTIVKADLASLIGALVLYFLTTGAVRGFAFYLGIATVMDLIGSYFFMGPAVRLLARRRSFRDHPSWYGLPADTGTGA